MHGFPRSLDYLITRVATEIERKGAGRSWGAYRIGSSHPSLCTFSPTSLATCLQRAWLRIAGSIAELTVSLNSPGFPQALSRQGHHFDESSALTN